MASANNREYDILGSNEDLKSLSRQLRHIPKLLNEKEPQSLAPLSCLLVGQEEHKVNVHTAVLLSRCPYVAAMLNSSLKESHARTTDFRLPDLTIEGVQACVDYMYSGSFTVRNDTVAQVLQASKYLLIDGIEKNCASFIADHLLDTSNAMDLLGSSIQLESQPLKDCVLEFIAKNTKAVVRSCSYSDGPSFGLEKISSDQIAAILELPRLSIPEEQVLRFATSWLEVQKLHSNFEAYQELVMNNISYCAFPKQRLEDFLRDDSVCGTNIVIPKDHVREAIDAKEDAAARERIPLCRRRREVVSVLAIQGPDDVWGPHDVQLRLCNGARWDGNILDLRAHNSYVEVPEETGTAFDATTTCCMEAWVQPFFEIHERGQVYFGPVLSKHGSACGWELRLGRGQIEFLVTLKKGNQQWHEVIGVDMLIENNRWLHIAGSFDGMQMALYVNGVKADGAQRRRNWNNMSLQNEMKGAVPVAHGNHLWLGRNSAWQERKLRCKIAGVRIFNEYIPHPSDFLRLSQ